MKLTATILSTLVGVLFAVGAAFFLAGKIPQPALTPDTPVYQFTAIMSSTGYMVFVKLFELIGGVLLAIPKTRNFGLLVLTPILANILMYDFRIDRTALAVGLVLVAIFAFLFWTERARFLSLLR